MRPPIKKFNRTPLQRPKLKYTDIITSLLPAIQLNRDVQQETQRDIKLPRQFLKPNQIKSDPGLRQVLSTLLPALELNSEPENPKLDHLLYDKCLNLASNEDNVISVNYLKLQLENKINWNQYTKKEFHQVRLTLYLIILHSLLLQNQVKLFLLEFKAIYNTDLFLKIYRNKSNDKKLPLLLNDTTQLKILTELCFELNSHDKGTSVDFLIKFNSLYIEELKFVECVNLPTETKVKLLTLCIEISNNANLILGLITDLKLVIDFNEFPLLTLINKLLRADNIDTQLLYQFINAVLDKQEEKSIIFNYDVGYKIYKLTLKLSENNRLEESKHVLIRLQQVQKLKAFEKMVQFLDYKLSIKGRRDNDNEW